MNRFRAWGLTAALAVSAAVPAKAADDPPVPARQPGEQTTLFDKLFGPKPKKPAPATGAKASTITAPLPPEIVAGALRAEQDAWERRMSVCLKLRQVAADKNDEALSRQVDELERQATALYTTRVAALGVPRVKSALPENATAAASLDRQLGSGAAVTPLTAPAAPTPTVRTAEARKPAPTGDYREVSP
jgi:hypothetical protein